MAPFTGAAGRDVANASGEELAGFTRGIFAGLTSGVLILSIAGGLRRKSSLFANVLGYRFIQ